MKRIGLALGGGGARGISHIAFLKVLDDMNIQPSIIAGASIGAIIGALYASGLSGRQQEKLLDDIGFIDMYRMADFKFFNTSALLKGNGVNRFLAKRLKIKTFDQLRIPLKIVATDFWNRQQVILESGDLMTAVRASISLPAIFEPVEMDGRVLIDGGAVNPLPYDIIRNDCDVVIAVDVTGEKQPNRKKNIIPTMLESLLSTFQIMQTAIIQSKMRENQPDIYIRPELKNIRILEFDKYKKILKSVEPDAASFRDALTEALH